MWADRRRDLMRETNRYEIELMNGTKDVGEEWKEEMA
jgi:hypothetical protein